MNNETTIETKSEWRNENEQPAEWQWAMHSIFMPISMTLTIIGSMIMKIGNLFMFDTHHLTIDIKPKGE